MPSWACEYRAQCLRHQFVGRYVVHPGSLRLVGKELNMDDSVDHLHGEGARTCVLFLRPFYFARCQTDFPGV